MPSNNLAIISSAGSRKTTYVVEEALRDPAKKVLILTFTIDNLSQIRRYIIDRKGFVPSNVTILSWYSFLLQDCVRPYQNFLYGKKRVKNVLMAEGQSVRYISKGETERYYFANSDRIFTDKICDFICRCNAISDGLVIKRLERIYDQLFIDEVQDLAGYDLDFLELLFKSTMQIVVVGDNRQATYFTNYSSKNRSKKGIHIFDQFLKWRKRGLCDIQERNECYRCNQSICDFADALYPSMPKTVSKNDTQTGHDGIFYIKSCEVQQYVERYKPTVLRYNRGSATAGLPAINFGVSKGLTYDRVLIFPTNGIKKYLKSRNISDLGDVSKFYVAVTRARYSVAIVCDEPSIAQLALFSSS